jgi:hypothetical protein
MINRWVIIKGQEKEFYILDSYLYDLDTRYIGYYEGNKELVTIGIVDIFSLGKKTRFVQ